MNCFLTPGKSCRTDFLVTTDTCFGEETPGRSGGTVPAQGGARGGASPQPRRARRRRPHPHRDAPSLGVCRLPGAPRPPRNSRACVCGFFVCLFAGDTAPPCATRAPAGRAGRRGPVGPLDSPGPYRLGPRPQDHPDRPSPRPRRDPPLPRAPPRAPARPRAELGHAVEALSPHAARLSGRLPPLPSGLEGGRVAPRARRATLRSGTAEKLNLFFLSRCWREESVRSRGKRVGLAPWAYSADTQGLSGRDVHDRHSHEPGCVSWVDSPCKCADDPSSRLVPL